MSTDPTAASPADGRLQVSSRHEADGTVVVSVAGEMDMDVLDPLRAALATVLATRPSRLVVDLDGVGFCDSAGLNLLLRAHQDATAVAVPFHLRAVPQQPLRLLQLTGADGVFSILEAAADGPQDGGPGH